MSRFMHADGTLVAGLWVARADTPELPPQVREQVKHLGEHDYPVSTETDEFEVVVYDGCVAWRTK